MLRKENARRDATPQRADANFWWREQYQFACLSAISAGAISNLKHRFLDGNALNRPHFLLSL
jgi:hypothetical protein